MWVATHELGHILGLEHDNLNRDAVMYPYYRSYTPNMQLHGNDIARLRRLYGYGKGSVNGGFSGNGGNGGNGCKYYKTISQPPDKHAKTEVQQQCLSRRLCYPQ